MVDGGDFAVIVATSEAEGNKLGASIILKIGFVKSLGAGKGAAVDGDVDGLVGGVLRDREGDTSGGETVTVGFFGELTSGGKDSAIQCECAGANFHSGSAAGQSGGADCSGGVAGLIEGGACGFDLGTVIDLDGVVGGHIAIDGDTAFALDGAIEDEGGAVNIAIKTDSPARFVVFNRLNGDIFGDRKLSIFAQPNGGAGFRSGRVIKLNSTIFECQLVIYVKTVIAATDCETTEVDGERLVDLNWKCEGNIFN